MLHNKIAEVLEPLLHQLLRQLTKHKDFDLAHGSTLA
jgi:hypothetical protein